MFSKTNIPIHFDSYDELIISPEMEFEMIELPAGSVTLENISSLHALKVEEIDADSTGFVL